MRIQQIRRRRTVATNVTPLFGRRRAFGGARHVRASHDLHVPLQVISSYVEMLADGSCGPVTTVRRGYLMRVRGNTNHLSAIAGSILSIARAERDGRTLEPTDVPVRELLSEVHALVEPFATADGVSLVVDCEHAPAVVRGERTALLQVLTSLAWNAVKLTRRDGRVSLSALAIADAVELRVVDTAPGIPPAALDAIFESVVHLQLTDEIARSGTGLGLTIARELTRLMGGELLVQSRAGVGSLFAARFPTARRPARQAARLPRSRAA